MATLYMEEHDQIVGVDFPIVSAPVATQKVAVSGTSTQSNAFSSRVRYLRIASDVDAQFAIGFDPTADANGRYLPAKVPLDLGVEADMKIAVIEKQ